MTELLHKKLTYKIIGVYYDVYDGLSHTYPEFIYENAMMAALEGREIVCRRQEELQVYYKERVIGAQRLPFSWPAKLW